MGGREHCTALHIQSWHSTHLAAASRRSFTLNSPDRANSMCTGSTRTMTAHEYLQQGAGRDF